MNMLVALCVCVVLNQIGSSKCAMEAKIVGGKIANMTEFAHSAYLSIQCELKRTLELFGWICGSSILNQRLLLTAAHCLAECSPNSWVSVSVGHTHVKKGWRSSGSSYLIHENYYPDTTINDIGLVKLRTALKLNANVNRVILLKKPPHENMARVAGWGVVDEETNKYGINLKVINQRVWNMLDCLHILKSIPRGTFCASSDIENDYVSGGDSGSALIIRGYIQIGLVSYKKPETSRNVIVYTDTSYFYNWIKENAERLHCVE